MIMKIKCGKRKTKRNEKILMNISLKKKKEKGSLKKNHQKKKEI